MGRGTAGITSARGALALRFVSPMGRAGKSWRKFMSVCGTNKWRQVDTAGINLALSKGENLLESQQVSIAKFAELKLPAPVGRWGRDEDRLLLPGRALING